MTIKPISNFTFKPSQNGTAYRLPPSDYSVPYVYLNPQKNINSSANYTTSHNMTVKGEYKDYYYVVFSAGEIDRWMFVPKSNASITQAAEKTYDLALQKRVHDYYNAVLGTGGTAGWEWKWWNMSSSTREQELRNFAKEIISRMNLSSQIKVVFEPLGETSGGYTHRDASGKLIRTIYINENLMSSNISYELGYTIIHEARHAYQEEVIDDSRKHPVSQETRGRWKNNIDNYIDFPGLAAPTASKNAYCRQPIEWDAFKFAKQSPDELNNFKPSYANSWS